MIQAEQIFNDNTVNIFTDASVKNHGQTTETIAGMELYNRDLNVERSRYTRLIPSTVNEGEIYAIYMAIMTCVEIKEKYPDENYTFNIFSDSRISVLGLREWYSNWVDMTLKNDTEKLINSSKEFVMNQQLFINCFDYIIKSGIHINFYHIRGHMCTLNPRDIDKFTTSFKEINKLNDYPSRELVSRLILMNDLVDRKSRSYLLPSAQNKENIPTITGTHRPDISSYENISIKSEYLFNVDKLIITENKKRYAELVDYNKF